jgi:hypothetical protein
MEDDGVCMTAVARMLLANDGSTSVLLEALAECKLKIRVESQRAVGADAVAISARLALSLASSDQVIERRSCLLTPGRDIVSVNLVVYDADAIERFGEPDSSRLIGHQLREEGVSHIRDQVSSGRDTWPETSLRAPCAYKEYVIRYQGGGRAYFHERFSPRWVPLSGIRQGSASR